MAIRSRRITYNTHPWVYESKQIYWDLQLNYNIKLMWIPSHVRISGNEVTDGLARQAVENGTVRGQMKVANDHRIFAGQACLPDRRYWLICSFNLTCGLGQTMV
jgi:hypothetical protein